jgi:mutator protein MutT
MVYAKASSLRQVSDARLLRHVSGAGVVSTAAIDVVAALIRDDAGRYLITRRRKGTHLEGLWEFPGGKREAGETLEESLGRELTEELGATFRVGERVETVRWSYPEKTVVLHFFACRVTTGAIAPQEGQLMEWVAPGDLRRFEFPPADAALLARLEAQR